MSRPPRLLLVITSLDRGGAQRQVVDLAGRLTAAGWTVAVLSMVRPTEYVDELRAYRVPVASLRMGRGRPTPLAFARYGRVLRAWRPDVVHAHMVHANLLARLGRLFAPRVPVVSTVHNVNEGARWRELAYRVTDPLSSLTTAVSAAAARRYIEVGAVPPGRITPFPNGFDFSRPTPPGARAAVRAELGVSDDAFLWITAGRLDPQKGYDLLLESMLAVRAAHPTVRLAIAGDGPERSTLDGILARLDLAGNVTLLGDRPDVPALLAAADGFVLSSRWEGLPMVLLEAAAAGLPIVATDVGGNGEIVQTGKGGVLVNVAATSIAEGMVGLMDMPAEARVAIGAALAAHVATHYDMAAVTKRWMAVYGSLGRARARRA